MKKINTQEGNYFKFRRKATKRSFKDNNFCPLFKKYTKKAHALRTIFKRNKHFNPIYIYRYINEYVYF